MKKKVCGKKIKKSQNPGENSDKPLILKGGKEETGVQNSAGK